MTKKGLITKKVAFQGKTITMYSIDGVTWSTRPDELQAIVDRHAQQQAAFTADLKGEEREKVVVEAKPKKKFTRVHDDDEIDEAIDDDLEVDPIAEDIDLADDTDIDLVSDVDKAILPVKDKKVFKAIVKLPLKKPIDKKIEKKEEKKAIGVKKKPAQKASKLVKKAKAVKTKKTVSKSAPKMAKTLKKKK